MNRLSSKLMLLLALAAPAAAYAQRPVGPLQAEFKMPIYRNATEAELTVVVPEDGPKVAKVEIQNPNGSTLRTASYKLKGGRNSCTIKRIGSFDEGRYPVMITLGDTTVKRLLRIEHVPAIEAPKEPIKYRKLIFTPDNYLFEKVSKNLKVEFSKPEMIEAVPNRDTNVIYVVGNDFYRAEDGRYVITGTSNPYTRYKLYADHPVYFNAVADRPEGPYTFVDERPRRARDSRENVFEVGPVICNDRKDGPFELYDPAKHGTYKLEDVCILQNIDPKDYGCVKAGYRTYWSFVRTSTGDEVFLSDKPVFNDIPVYGVDMWDNGFNTNDNFGNSWYSADSTVRFIARGQTLRRDAPYDLAYDMVDTRIMTSYSTSDGINWKYNRALTADGKRDTPYTQQYGARVCYLPEAGLYLVFVEDFHGDMQQTGMDLDYSRDGINFYDAPGESPFIYTDNRDDFYWGGIYGFNTDIVKCGKKYYQLISEAMTWPHFFAEPLFARNRLSEVTGDDFQRIFGGRGMAEKLPYFDEIGGWEGLAKQTRDGHCSVALISYRADGWFGVEAGSKAGSFTTNPIVGGGRLYVNAEIADDGYIKVEQVGGGKSRKAILHGDDLKIPAFDLSDGAVKLKVTMRNAKLYTMYIE